MTKMSIPFHPFLLALYPILIILAKNSDTFSPLQAGRSVLIVCLITSIFLIIFHKLFRDIHRTSLLTSLFVFMLFYLGSSYTLPPKITLLGFSIQREIIFICAWAIFSGIAGSKWVWQRVRPFVITKYMNIIAVVALINLIWILASQYIYLPRDPLADWKNPLPFPSDITPEQASDMPDIYYIILDGYARADVLKRLYEYDNSNFLDDLQKRGFFVANESQSNYNQTGLSLASSMNFEYLDFFNGVNSENRHPLTDLIVNSRVRRIVEDMGYTTVTISSEYTLVDLIDADVYIDIEESGLNGFEKMLLSISSLRFLDDLGLAEIPAFGFKNHRNWVLSQFNVLEGIVTITGPKFVYIHITAPHPPFVFDRQGDLVIPDMNYSDADGALYFPSTETYIDGYRNQVEYINQRVMITIDHILRNSQAPPVILLQADHGPGAYLYWESAEKSCLWERMSILNAYYLPRYEGDGLYDQITPVNTFRMIFDEYFGTNYGFLDDKIYFSSRSHPYQFTEIIQGSSSSCPSQ
jgi:hypothetical protein